MANYLVTDTQLTSVADAIRAKTGQSGGLSFPSGMVSALNDLVLATYHVYYYNQDGTTLLNSEIVSKYSIPTGYTVPEKQDTAQYDYTAVGWSKTTNSSAADSDAYAGVTADRTLYAAYSQAVRSYTITFVKASEDGGETLQSSNVAYGSTPSYSGTTPTSSRVGYEFTGWSPAISSVTGDQIYTAVFAGDTITDSLSEMCTKLANGTANYNIGDYKTIDLGTEGQIRMQVAAKNADALASGSGNAAYTWVAMDLLNTSHRMNPSLSGTTEGTGAVGGWGKSEMRTYLSETIWPLLPSELRTVIKEVKKYSCIYNTSGTKVSDDVSNDKLWIPSVHEVFNNNTYETQGSAYTGIFSNSTNRKRFKPGASSAYFWWERSAYSTSGFMSVGDNGDDTSGSANIRNGVLLGFCT